MSHIDRNKIKLVIFDVDGTLYDQSKLRRLMFKELFFNYIIRPWKILDLFIIYKFRSYREKLAKKQANNLEFEQYNVVAKSLGVSIERVKLVIQDWIFKRPLKYLKPCRFDGLVELIEKLSNKNIQVVYFSDYPLENKLTNLDLPFSNKNIFYSVSSEIDALKPNTKGLIFILEKFGLNAESVLLIGDRQDKEGIMAQKIGMPYLIINKRQPSFYKNFLK